MLEAFAHIGVILISIKGRVIGFNGDAERLLCS
jgi:hypothetical protein